jgi:hypothetical protein
MGWSSNSTLRVEAKTATSTVLRPGFVLRFRAPRIRIPVPRDDLHNAQVLMKGYAASVSGVLMGMTDVLQPQDTAAPKAAPTKARKKG